MIEVAVLDPTFVVKATICSILPSETGQDHTIINRTHGCYFVHHPKDKEPYALSHVGHKVDYADVGDYDPAKVKRGLPDPRKQFHFDAKQIAEDICKQINDNGPGDASFFGVFVCAGSEPTERELEKAHERLNRYFMQCVVAADSQWSASPRHDLISGVAKRGARYLKLNPEDHGWMSNFQQMADCPACGLRVKPGVAMCRGCGTILDEKKWRSFYHADDGVKIKERKPRKHTVRQGENIPSQS